MIESGLTVVELGLTVVELGLTVIELGLTVVESGLTVVESGLTVVESGRLWKLILYKGDCSGNLFSGIGISAWGKKIVTEY